MPNQLPDQDPTAVARKKDHIDLAFRSQVDADSVDNRFFYEPLLAGHPQPGSLVPFSFLNTEFKAPLWVSSMTGGTALAGTINHNLARACAEFGLGMGLGSCRQLLYSNQYFADFDVRDTLGADRPLFANLGIAQIDRLLADNEAGRMADLVQKLRANGLIVHINPLQEALQPEGDRFGRPPLDTIDELLEKLPGLPIIVKEVGQGMGPASIKALMERPIEALEFAAAGGTNFAKLELLRGDTTRYDTFAPLIAVGHTAWEMMGFVAQLYNPESCKVKNLIVSGGIQNFLDGYALIRRAPLPAVYGQASGFLRHAQGDYETLRQYVATQIAGLEMAYAWLQVR